VKPDCPRSSTATEAETAAHPPPPLAGLFGDPDGCGHPADRADGDPANWTTLFTRPRERSPL
jgi:hypothetical protein